MFKKAKKYLLLSSVITLGLTLSAGAANEKNFAVDLGVGLNTLDPYGALRLHYAPEATGPFTWNTSFQVGQRFSKTTNATDLNFIGTLGSRYYFLQEGMFQPFISADLGVSSHGGFNEGKAAPGFFGLLGIGSDFMVNESFGFSVAISSDLGILRPDVVMAGTLMLRPEINAKFKW